MSHPPSLVPALLVPLIAWRIYRRFHRNVGRQPLRRGRLVSGLVLFGLLSLGLLAATFTSPPLVGGLAAGLALGLPLGWWGLHLTRFETDSAGRHFYTPNTYIGIGLTLLLAGRVIYRIGVLYFDRSAATYPTPAFMQSPLTLVLLGLTAGYYLTYNTGVLLRAGRT